jgi:hypothetical protein
MEKLCKTKPQPYSQIPQSGSGSESGSKKTDADPDTDSDPDVWYAE